jgi:glycosyltransferase involved in cell wall biosynthesis
MRVVNVITRLNIGGASPPVMAVAAGLRARGHDSLLVVGTPEPHEGSMESDAAAMGVEIRRVPALRRNPAPVGDLCALHELWKIFRRTRPDVVATHMSKAGALGRIAARAAGVPVIVHTYHGKGFGVFDARWRTAAALAAERALASLASGSIVVSDKQRDEFEALRVGTGRLKVIRYGLDLDPFLREGEPGYLKRELGLPGTAVLVGVVGRLVAIKGQDVVLRAVAALGHEWPNLHVVLAGDGERRATYELLTRELGLGSRVHFLGWRRDVAPLLHGLDIVCLPTINDFEGTPLAVIEALAAARPVVATDVGGVSEVIRDGETGLLVAPRNAEAIAAGIRRLLQHPHDAVRMAAAGRTLATLMYRRERMVTETEQYFRDLLAASALRPAEAAS